MNNDKAMERCQRQYETQPEDSDLDELYAELALIKKEMVIMVGLVNPGERYIPKDYEKEFTELLYRWHEIDMEIEVIEEF